MGSNEQTLGTSRMQSASMTGNNTNPNPLFDLTVRRMAFAYGGALGEASLLCEDNDLETCALMIWNSDSGTEGDAVAADCILREARANGLTADETEKVSGVAWAKAMAAIRANRHSIIRIAKLMKDRHKVEDSEIREGLTIPQTKGSGLSGHFRSGGVLRDIPGLVVFRAGFGGPDPA